VDQISIFLLLVGTRRAGKISSIRWTTVGINQIQVPAQVGLLPITHYEFTEQLEKQISLLQKSGSLLVDREFGWQGTRILIYKHKTDI
jgi:hypothetical protein